MAQAPLAQHPPVPPAIANQPITYAAKFAPEDDILNGEYAPLFQRHLLNLGADPEDLLAHVTGASDIIPKVFLTLVEEAPNRLRVWAIHRFTAYRNHPTERVISRHRLYLEYSASVPTVRGGLSA